MRPDAEPERMRFLERRTVSRKTAVDGCVEITKPTAHQLEAHYRSLLLEVDGELVDVSIETMTCTCRGADHPHLHYFLQSDRLKSLQPEAAVELWLDENSGTIALRAEAQ